MANEYNAVANARRNKGEKISYFKALLLNVSKSVIAKQLLEQSNSEFLDNSIPDRNTDRSIASFHLLIISLSLSFVISIHLPKFSLVLAYVIFILSSSEKNLTCFRLQSVFYFGQNRTDFSNFEKRFVTSEFSAFRQYFRKFPRSLHS